MCSNEASCPLATQQDQFALYDASRSAVETMGILIHRDAPVTEGVFVNMRVEAGAMLLV